MLVNWRATCDMEYISGVVGPCLKNSWGEDFMKKIYKDWSPEERKKLITGAGFWIFNLKKMRMDGCEEKFLSFARMNLQRLKQPEQDCVNSVCWPHIQKLPLSSMVCTYLYDLYQSQEDLNNDLVYSFDELNDALTHPIQVHYATEVKPWNTPSCTKAHLWYNYLVKTPFFYEQMKSFVSPFTKQKWYLFGLIPVLKIRYNVGRLFKFFVLRRRF